MDRLAVRQELEARVWAAVEVTAGQVPPEVLARWLRSLGSDMWIQAAAEEGRAASG